MRSDSDRVLRGARCDSKPRSRDTAEPRRIAAVFFRLILAESFTLGPLALFARMLGAEGPTGILFGWTALVVTLLSAVLGGKVADETRHGIAGNTVRIALAAMTVLSGISGVLAVLVQVSVAHRSLAEAWLELAREGRAFGFFSFFASEIYALFLIAQVILLIRRRYLLFILAFAASALLCAGIVSGKSWALVLAVLCALAFFVFAGPGPRPNAGDFSGLTAVKRRLYSISVPLAAAAAFSLWFAFNPTFSVKTPFTGFDAEEIFSAIAPSFPLVRDVPGYGFEAGAGEMPTAVHLSGRTLFRVQGERGSVHYLATERYRDWNGETWLVDPATGDSLPVSRIDRKDAPARGALRLTLEEDFTPAIPLDFDTASVAVVRDAPEKYASFRNRGIRFEPSIRRGCVADLVPGTVTVTAPNDAEIAALLGNSGARSERISALAKTLRAKASSDREYIMLVMDWLSGGYEYSLRKGPTKKGDNPIESFLFTEKKGFCLYFASAFVLLSREAGLPARLCEGYRLRLDEHGQGVISGNNAHAWPEVWMDGAWQTFEPTPPYRLADPFALTATGDRETQRQLEAIFGVRKGTENAQRQPAIGILARFIREWARPLAIGSTTLAVIVLIILKLTNTETRKLKRKARRLVRRCGKKGIAGPGALGWTVWAEEAKKILKGSEAEDAARTADAMIALTFAPPRE